MSQINETTPFHTIPFIPILIIHFHLCLFLESDFFPSHFLAVIFNKLLFPISDIRYVHLTLLIILKYLVKNLNKWVSLFLSLENKSPGWRAYDSLLKDFRKALWSQIFDMGVPRPCVFMKLLVYSRRPLHHKKAALLLSELSDASRSVSVILLFRWQPHPQALTVVSKQLLTRRNYRALTWQPTGSVAPKSLSWRYFWRHVTLQASKRTAVKWRRQQRATALLTDKPTDRPSNWFSQLVQ